MEEEITFVIENLKVRSRMENEDASQMKSAYELAMERLNKTSPSVALTAEQKKQLAELDSKYAAKIAECEIGLNDQIGKAGAAGDFEKAAELQQQLSNERKKLHAELDDRKDRVRQRKS